MYVHGEPVSAADLTAEAEDEIVQYADDFGFPCDRNYRSVSISDSETGLGYNMVLSHRAGEPSVRVHSFHYDGDPEHAPTLFSSPAEQAAEVEYRSRSETQQLPVGLADALPDLNTGLRIAFPPPWGADADADDSGENVAGQLLSRLLLVPARVLRRTLEESRYVGPVRDLVPRTFEPLRFPDPRRWAGGLAAWEELCRHPDTLVPLVGKWLADAGRLNTGYGMTVREYRELTDDDELAKVLEGTQTFEHWDTDEFRVMLCDLLRALPVKRQPRLVSTATGQAMHPADVGQGLTQAVPVVVAALHPFESGLKPRGGLVAIEQPELHLHPAAQVGLGDLFIAGSQLSGHRLLVETHSEHLLLRLLRRIRQTTANTLGPGQPGLTPDQLAVICFEPPTDGNPTRVYRLRIDDQGEFLDPWPRGFFDERSEELFGS